VATPGFGSTLIMISAVIINGLVSWQNFIKLEASAPHEDRFQAGAPGKLGVEVSNQKRMVPAFGLRLCFEIEHLHRPDRDPIRLNSDVFNLSRFTRNRILTPWTPPARGRYRITLVSIDSIYPFGFIQKSFFIRKSCKILVWPDATRQVESFRLESSHQQQQLHRNSQLKPEIDQLYDLRNYRPGDSVRAIQWKKSAQQDTLVVREAERRSASDFSLLFDFHESGFSGDTEAEMDTFCSCIASWLCMQHEQRKRCRVQLHLNPAIPLGNRADLHRLIDALAVIEIQKKTIPQSLLQRAALMRVRPIDFQYNVSNYPDTKPVTESAQAEKRDE